jgi:hypothetical protein
MSGDGKSISPESGKGKIAYDFGTDKHDCQLTNPNPRPPVVNP